MQADARLMDYAREIPAIYRELLAAFPRLDPARKAGYGLAFGTLAADFEERRQPYRLPEIVAASGQLAEHGLVEVKNRIFVHPTPRGEQLISAITGVDSPTIPKLPPPPTS